MVVVHHSATAVGSHPKVRTARIETGQQPYRVVLPLAIHRHTALCHRHLRRMRALLHVQAAQRLMEVALCWVPPTLVQHADVRATLHTWQRHVTLVRHHLLRRVCVDPARHVAERGALAPETCQQALLRGRKPRLEGPVHHLARSKHPARPGIGAVCRRSTHTPKQRSCTGQRRAWHVAQERRRGRRRR